MEMNEKKHVLLEDEMSDWLQIWMAASLLEVKNNKAKKRENFVCFLLSGLFSQIRSR